MKGLFFGMIYGLVLEVLEQELCSVSDSHVKQNISWVYRNAYASFEDKLSDEMCHHFANKNLPEFWKVWNAKFKKNVNNNVNINGYTDNAGIANEFAEHFNNVYYYSSEDCDAINNCMHHRQECVVDKDVSSQYSVVVDKVDEFVNNVPMIDQ